MAKKPKATEGEEGATATDAPAAGSKKKKMIMIGVAALVVLGGGGYYFKMRAASHAAEEAAKAMEKPPIAFIDMKDMTVNLAQSNPAAPPRSMKLKVSLEVADQKLATQIQPLLPRIEDTFQVYMRELRQSDLEGSAGVYRLKEELLRRVNVLVQPAHVDTVLFKELVVQ